MTDTSSPQSAVPVEFAELLTVEPAPGPAGRVQRTAGQVGAVLVLLELWLAFGWFGSEDWTERQLLAVTAVATLLASVVQNATGHLTGRRARQT